jgi:hypothetical protein
MRYYYYYYYYSFRCLFIYSFYVFVLFYLFINFILCISFLFIYLISSFIRLISIIIYQLLSKCTRIRFQEDREKREVVGIFHKHEGRHIHDKRTVEPSIQYVQSVTKGLHVDTNKFS